MEGRRREGGAHKKNIVFMQDAEIHWLTMAGLGPFRPALQGASQVNLYRIVAELPSKEGRKKEEKRKMEGRTSGRRRDGGGKNEQKQS